MRISIALFICLVAPLNGCATPQPIRQALLDKDDAYAKNVQLAGQYRALTEQADTRLRIWYIYIQSRITLSAAMKWITTDPRPPIGVSPQNDVDLNQRMLFDNQLVATINELRLTNLPERRGTEYPGASTAIFKAGTKKSLDDLIQAAPELARLSREFAATRFDELTKSAPSPGNSVSTKPSESDAYAKYIAAVGALRQLNAAERAYLNIDVTVKSDDIKSLIESVKALATTK
ncbi:MAG TPA: hypothetical protein VG326_11545 [Tepidisphaeraceae bacterium]|jgi:hypothetical protein|nr:hypothetical protein [Tepidisphaeraceae bacterium]